MLKFQKIAAGLFLLLFLFRSVPEQYWIFLHPHEHDKYHKISQHSVLSKAYHNCKDHLTYVNVKLIQDDESFSVVLPFDQPVYFINISEHDYKTYF